jgi:hypothetical protein
LSAAEYWAALGWETANVPPGCDLLDRPRKNFMMYIADAQRWDSGNFWRLRDLRIISTPASVLRYHLHLIVNFVLTGERRDLFGNEVDT